MCKTLQKMHMQQVREVEALLTFDLLEKGV